MSDSEPTGTERSLGQAFVEMGEYFRPGFFVSVLRLAIRESRVGEPEQRTVFDRYKFDRHHRFSASGCLGKPSQFQMAIAIQGQEPSIVGMPFTFKLGFEKERAVDFALHEYGTGGRKPAIEPLRPSPE